MAEAIEVKSKAHLDANLAATLRAMNEFAESGGGTIEFVKAKKQRTLTQNNSLHKYLELLADALNDAGLDMKRVLKQEVDIPWTKESAKEFLWRPVQKVMINELSTADAETSEYSVIYNALSRHISEKFGIYIPWPSNRG